MTISAPIFISSSPHETQQLGALLATHCYPGLTVLFFGDLGSGKTEFVRGFVHALGFDRVRSPSFGLVHEYPTDPPVVHADLYRISPGQDIDDLGLEESTIRGAVLLVEWAERWTASPREDCWAVSFSFSEKGHPMDAEQRIIRIDAWGTKAHEHLLRTWDQTRSTP